ncbi:MAG TPA: type 2 lanthipeptide synthetase LanM family protein [Pyrinomonadaceae bacterium]|nr:type 2 lanthipeptide synthetase LanM family protein [Pyrinomonadaceae bacterium]
MLRSGALASGRGAKSEAESAEEFLRQWRSQAPFQSDSLFARRLAQDGLTERDFIHILAVPAERLRDVVTDPPRWLCELSQAFSATDARATPAPDLPPELAEAQSAAFLNAVTPLSAHFRARLSEGIQALVRRQPRAPFDAASALELLYANVPAHLLGMISRTMVLELNVARLQGLLEGGTPAERFASFTARLRERGAALALLAEYPVLARQLVLTLEQWAESSLEFLARLGEDWRELCRLFRIDGAARLSEVESGLGDTHRGGRSVVRIKFDTGHQLVYKPRSLAVDVHFQNLLAWLNERGARPEFRTIQILDRSAHGWVEFVRARDCASVAEVRRFYERQGGYLALLYALEATDFHHENLIAAGEHPVLVDLETLFHPRIEDGRGARPELELARHTAARSVLRTGLLPFRVGAADARAGVDLSGLGAVAGQLTPDKILQWEQGGTDEMRARFEQVTMPGARNRPRLAGGEIRTLDYVEEIVNGFSRTYELLRARRSELLADEGPLAAFAGDEVRAVVRHTRGYGLFLYESFHPDLLRDELERERFFDRLWLGVEEHPRLTRVLSAERADLLEGCVPKFTARTDSRDIWSSAGARVSDFFDEPGLALVRRRLGRLSDEDLARQVWFIRASLATLASGEEDWSWPGYRLEESGQPSGREILREQLLAEARRVGDRLEELALRDERDATWLGLAYSQQHWALVPLGEDLYGGTPGIILFLAYLGALTGEGRYTDLARVALATLRRGLSHAGTKIRMVGAFQGWGGIVYLLTHLSRLWGDPGLIAEAEEIVKALPPLVEQDEHNDIISGAAGCLASLLCLHACAPSRGTLVAALQCGTRLLERAQPMEQGLAWFIRVDVARPPTGFSHGASGVAWALLELSALTGEERFRRAALEAVAYERSQFSAETGNWLDPGDPDSAARPGGENAQRLTLAWCYGAPGIGLARARMLRHADDEVLREDLEAALKVTLGGGFGRNHSLCHGDLGNLELLLQAGDALSDAALRLRAESIAAGVLKSIERDGWLCGTPLTVQSPGLMNGLAGIGYGLLRLAAPERVPAVLMLES